MDTQDSGVTEGPVPGAAHPQALMLDAFPRILSERSEKPVFDCSLLWGPLFRTQEPAEAEG